MDPKKIKAAREAHGLRQYELAMIAGTSAAQMSRIESGKRRIRLDEAERIAVRLKLDISDIVDESARAPIAKGHCKRASLPLPEGQATIEYPADLSPESRAELQKWLELLGRIISRSL